MPVSGAKPAATYGTIGRKSRTLRIGWRIDIAQISHRRRGHTSSQTFKVQCTELIPFGQKHYRIRILGSVIRIFEPLCTRQKCFALGKSLRVDNTHDGPPRQSRPEQWSGWARRAYHPCSV